MDRTARGICSKRSCTELSSSTSACRRSPLIRKSSERTGTAIATEETVLVVISLLASALFIAALALIYAATGTVNMADLAGAMDQVDPGLRTEGILTLRLTPPADGYGEAAELDALHARASAWFEADGDLPAALEQAARMRDQTRLLELLDARVPT